MALKERPDLADLPSISFEEWKEKAEKDLKGKSLDDLSWESEGFTIEPFFTREHVPGKDIPHPGQSPYRRGVLPASNDWWVRSAFSPSDEERIEKALEYGIQCITLRPEEREDHPSLPDPAKGASRLEIRPLKDVELWKVQLEQNRNALPSSGGLLWDPVEQLLHNGDWPGEGMEEAIATLDQHSRWLEEQGLNWHSVPVNGTSFHNAGASLSEELAFTLSQGHELLVALLEKGWALDELTPRFLFELPAGPLFLPEIAKFRAFRQLWARIVEAYEPEHECTKAPWISANTSWWSLTRNDPYTNMVRKTSEAMASVIGGCQQLFVHPYDEAGKENSELGLRVARNTHHLLKEESALNQVVDPLGGSYYLEILTDRIGEAAWDLVKDVEEQGGFFAALEKGIVQERIQKTRSERKDSFQNGERSILGVNRYRNEEASPLSEKANEQKAPPTGGSIEALPQERAAFGLE